jgi:hypothetical protein
MAMLPLYAQKNAYYIPPDADVSQGLYNPAPAGATAVSDDDQAAHLKPMVESVGIDSGNVPPVNERTAPQTAAMMRNPDVSRDSMKSKIDSLFSGDTYTNYTLPFLGILEAVATQGKSPGTAALNVRNQVLDERKMKLTEEEKTVEMQGQREDQAQKTVQRKLLQEKQAKVKAIPLDAPDYAQQVAKIEMQYNITPEEAMNYQRVFKQQKSLSPQELLDLQARFPNVGTETFQNDADGWRKQLAMVVARANMAHVTGTTFDQKKALHELPKPVGNVSYGTGLVSGKSVANVNPGTPQGQTAVQQYGDSIISGNAPPDLKGLLSRNAPFAIAVTQYVKTKDPEFNLPDAVGDYSYWNDKKNKQNRQVINAFQAQAPALAKAVDELKLSGIPALDSHAIDALYAAGNVKAANLLTNLGVLIEDVTKATAGGNASTDKQMVLAQTILKKGATPDQLHQMLATAIEASNERKLTMYQQGGVYGRSAAKTDPWLPDDFKQAILSGSFHVQPAQGQAQPEARPHQQDSQAVIWAKANLNDPRAIKILQLNGIQ